MSIPDWPDPAGGELSSLDMTGEWLQIELAIESACRVQQHRPARSIMMIDDQFGDPAVELRRRADRIASLIVASDYPDIDIDIEIAGLRRWCAEHLPDRLDLFEMVYGSRFRRLREQFRNED